LKTFFLNRVCVLVLFVFFGCSQKKSDRGFLTPSKDSLSLYFSLANDFNLPRDKRHQYIVKAYEIVINQDNDSLKRVNLFKVANRFYNINNWSDYRKTVRLTIKNSEEAGDTISMAKAYTYLGEYYQSQSIPDSAFLFYNRAEKMYFKLNDNLSLAKILFSEANLKYFIGDFSVAENDVFRILRITKNLKQANSILYDSYNLLGLIYNQLGEFDNAIKYNNKALSVINDKIMPKEYQFRATSYNNIGYMYLNAHNYKRAKEYFQKGLNEDNLSTQYPSLYAMVLDNLAYTKFKLKEDDGLPDLFYQSLKLGDSLKISSGVFLNKIHLSEYFSSKYDTINALKYSREALSLARNTNVSRDILMALKQISLLEPEKAVAYSKEYIRINEDLLKEERRMGEKFSRIEYETDQIKGENSDLESKNRKLIYFFSSITIFGLFIYIINLQKAKNRELQYKQQQQQANEDIYSMMISQQNTIELNRMEEKRRVAQELHDGVLGRIFGVRMNLEGLNTYNDDEAVTQRIDYLSELKSIEQDIREISHDLNRQKSELINNFLTIVDNLFEEQRNTFNYKLISNIDSNIKWDLASNSVKINLYRIIQECLQNINKYAKAKIVKIEVKKKDNNIVLVVSDDGIGFNVNVKKKGIGLQNMISRTKECNGNFNIKSKKGEGTVITITIPLEEYKIPVNDEI